MALPIIIQKVVNELDENSIPNDTVVKELKNLASKNNIKSDDLAMAMSVYFLSFGEYKGFGSIK